MKTILKSIFFSVALVLGAVSCQSDYEIPPTGDPDQAEHLAVGTYVGTWTQTNVKTGEVANSKPGSITFGLVEEVPEPAEGEEAPATPAEPVILSNVVSIQVEAEFNLGVEAEESACNITRLSSGVLTYWNTHNKNPFGMTFTGKIYPDGGCTMTYTKIVRQGRREREFVFLFEGTKQ